MGAKRVRARIFGVGKVRSLHSPRVERCIPLYVYVTGILQDVVVLRAEDRYD